MIRVGVAGAGYWGPNLVRNFGKDERCRVVGVSDLDARRLEGVARDYPSVSITTNPLELLDEADAVAIATPISTHYELAKAAIERGLHVLVEKPMTATVAESEELIALAEKAGTILMVDHTFIYTGAVRAIRELIDSGEIGDVFYFDSVRVNLGLLQSDVNVLWDLGPHDFSIMSYLLDRKPARLSAVGARPVAWEGWDLESLAYVTVWLEGGSVAHFNLNWLSPVKIRRTLIGGSRRMVVYDALDVDNQVKIFDKGVDVRTSEELWNMLVQYRAGDMVSPKVDQTEALEVACAHFLDCIQKEETPLTDGRAGLQVVRLLEAAQRSMEAEGEVVGL